MTSFVKLVVPLLVALAFAAVNGEGVPRKVLTTSVKAGDRSLLAAKLFLHEPNDLPYNRAFVYNKCNYPIKVLYVLDGATTYSTISYVGSWEQSNELRASNVVYWKFINLNSANGQDNARPIPSNYDARICFNGGGSSGGATPAHVCGGGGGATIASFSGGGNPCTPSSRVCGFSKHALPYPNTVDYTTYPCT